MLSRDRVERRYVEDRAGGARKRRERERMGECDLVCQVKRPDDKLSDKTRKRKQKADDVDKIVVRLDEIIVRLDVKSERIASCGSQYALEETHAHKKCWIMLYINYYFKK